MYVAEPSEFNLKELYAELFHYAVQSQGLPTNSP